MESDKMWNIGKENMEELKRSSNRYNVLQNDYDAEFPKLLSPHKLKLVDGFLSKNERPTNDVLEKWSDDMKAYFEGKWKIIQNGAGVSNSNEMDKITQDVVDDPLDITGFLKENELKSKGKNVLVEGGTEGLFNV
ncbi:hypothetical protein CTI12_AA331970 [Artemisia annua]|uniref:Uncharacterized protein n=1 Tax=Artemisia annua TaxID=35608 RepID=A0A2U1MXN5_ARTAN|nr:hypothetical protein CTI12_AA331970 [Artemisia annua]